MVLECTVLDFFSGSATTAHAIMQLNAEDGGSRLLRQMMRKAGWDIETLHNDC